MNPEPAIVAGFFLRGILFSETKILSALFDFKTLSSPYLKREATGNALAHAAYHHHNQSVICCNFQENLVA